MISATRHSPGKWLRRSLLISAIAGGLLASSAQPAAALSGATKIDSVPGTILDFSPGRILYVAGPPDDGVLTVKNRHSGKTRALEAKSLHTFLRGFLTRRGAIFSALRGVRPRAETYEWRGRRLLDLGRADSPDSLQASGRFAIWNDGKLLYRRNLTSVNTFILSHKAGDFGNDVAANGDVVWWEQPSGHVFRYRNGTTRKLTHDAATQQTYPVTDGHNVAYRVTDPCCADSGSLALFTNGAEGPLASTQRDSLPAPPFDYAVAGGWVGFTRPDALGDLQVWTRDPSGNEQQASTGSGSAEIVAINRRGAVAYQQPSLGDLFIANPGSDPIEIGPRPDGFNGRGSAAGGFLLSFGKRWFEAEGGDLFLLDTRTTSVLSFTPDDGACGISRVEPSISVSFNRRMDKASAEDAFSLTRTINGEPVQGSFEWDGNTLIFHPDGVLVNSRLYTARIGDGAKSASGKPLSAPVSWEFTAAPYPLITGVSPADGATGVSTGTTVEVSFDSVMDRATAEAAFALTRKSDGAPVAGSFGWNGNTMVFTPSAPLDSGTVYAAHETRAAKEQGVHPVLTPMFWLFRTG